MWAVTVGAVVFAAVACSPVSAGERTPNRPTPRAVAAKRAPPSPLTLAEIRVSPEPHPLTRLSAAELAHTVRTETHELGSLSIGQPNRGALLNAVQMSDTDHWRLNDPDRSWATEETVNALVHAIREVVRAHPLSPVLVIGDMSKKRGGYFRPHRSHQSGRDVDLGYYYLGGAAWYKKADAGNLDRARTWTLLKSLLSQGSVEYVFMDKSVQVLLQEHALATENDTAWVVELFGHTDDKLAGTLRHVRGHQTHMHVRFYNDRATEAARLSYGLLTRYRKL